MLIAVDGTSFILANRAGDISGGRLGLFVRDTRYLSTWRLLVDGRLPNLLTSHHVDHYSSLVFLMNADSGSLPPNAVSISRRRVVGAGMEEKVEISSHLDHDMEFDVRLDVDVDFLDLFEVKADYFSNPGDQVFATVPAEEAGNRNLVMPTPAGMTLVFEQVRGAYHGRVTIEASPTPVIDEHGLAWRVGLPGHGSWEMTLLVSLGVDGEMLPRRYGLKDFGRGRALRRSAQRPATHLSKVTTSWTALQRTHDRAVDDLATLVIDEPDLASGLPAAGLPWFMTIFGRDVLMTMFQVLPGGQGLGWTAIETLARLQATDDSPARDAQPGKIVHELRRGPAATNSGQFPYYGTVDAPMLFIVLLHELWRWSGDDARARAYRPNAEAILAWMRTHGDLDGDGFIEWQRRSPSGLENQAWKDSWDAYRYHDGTLAAGPLASCEVQGYAFDALSRAAELADGPWGAPDLAVSLRADAAALFERFNDRFWSDERGGYYHLALDGAKRPVDSLTSNMGHLLWSGIVPAERASAVGRQLLSRELFSGWGIRTMATDDLGYNPISYHCGTVWPHDNSIAVAGLHRYGLHAEANRVLTALVEAAQAFSDSRLPEVFAGYDREAGPFPVQYPTASSPQAWACGSTMLMLRAALGLEPDPAGNGMTLDPHLPGILSDLRIGGISAFGRRFEVQVDGDRAEALPTD
ncbi:MAG: hypothetical protein QOE92_608 [Chloroflexota bacterium]|nr:hypothetical protein [Chloroflexota bacterium]